MTTFQALKTYTPFNEQEKIDQKEILWHWQNTPAVFERQNLTAHFTVSAWITNFEHNKVLMAYHNLYQAWSWLGGHADGERNLLVVIRREIKEESGLTAINLLSEKLYSLEILTVDGHEKNGHYVPSHLHLNLTYLFEANEKDRLVVNQAENSNLAWFTLNEAIEVSSENWFKKRIYPKLNSKLLAKKY